MKEYLLDTSEAVDINGQKYYLRFRSSDIANPVVLFLHGGCGSADRPFIMKNQSPLAALCTIVAWDQRGAGLAYNRKRAKTEQLTKEMYIEDMHNVVSYLKNRFNKEKIIIVGHSFGSQLGVWYAKRYAQDIECYVGIGQVVDFVENEKLSYNYVLERAKAKNDEKTLKILEKIGPPVNGFYGDENDTKILDQRKLLNKYGGIYYGKYGCTLSEWLAMVRCMHKEYSLKTLLNYHSANCYCINSQLGKERVNFFEEANQLDVPVYIFTGVNDNNCSYALAKKWFEILDAPYKKWVWFDKSGHEPQLEEPIRWNEVFASEVLKKQLQSDS